MRLEGNVSARRSCVLSSLSCVCVCLYVCVCALSHCKTFTRLAEQVLAANKKDLDLLRMSMNNEINLAALEEEEGLCDGAAGDQGKSCWC